MKVKYYLLGLILFFINACSSTSAKIESMTHPTAKSVEKKIFIAVRGHEKLRPLSEQITLKLDSVFMANGFKSYVFRYEPGLTQEEGLRVKIKEFEAPLLMSVGFTEAQTMNNQLQKVSFSSVLYDVNQKEELWKSKIDLNIGNGLAHTWSEDGVVFSKTLFNDLITKRVLLGL